MLITFPIIECTHMELYHIFLHIIRNMNTFSTDIFGRISGHKWQTHIQWLTHSYTVVNKDFVVCFHVQIHKWQFFNIPLQYWNTIWYTRMQRVCLCMRLSTISTWGKICDSWSLLSSHCIRSLRRVKNISSYDLVSLLYIRIYYSYYDNISIGKRIYLWWKGHQGKKSWYAILITTTMDSVIFGR